ncbi:MAG: hypothetical protein KKF44_04625 [Nanoarchaeota archaeon]|nr:hypothetical protein [Nanoarchaeota archaeon]
MIILSELKVVEDAFFKADLIYYKPSLYSFIEENFSENQPYSLKTLAKLRKIVKDSKDRAHDLILREDIKKIDKEIKSSPKEFDENIWKDFLPKIRHEVKTALGLDFKPRSIFFEESFPEGLGTFEKKGASSITIFEGQNNAGIYFLKKRISSFYTPLLLIHEQLHSCLSQNKTKDQIYVEWFEEGIAMWFSILIYYKLTKNKEVIDIYKERNYIYSKVKPEYNFVKRYFEYIKIMSCLYLSGGPKLFGMMMVDYLSNKREKVNKYLDLEKYDIKFLPKSDIENLLLNMTLFIEPEKTTPLEYLILKSIKKPKTIETIAMLTGAPVDVVQKFLFRLQVKGMIVAKDKYLEMNWRKKDLFEHKLIRPIYPF